MKADFASHLLRQPISFELFFFCYLVCALMLQKINIYKTNFHMIDFNLVLFTIVVLSRRLCWCIFQQFQSRWLTVRKVPRSSSKDSLLQKWMRVLESGISLKHMMVVLCTLLVIAWFVVRLIQHTSIFNLLFLFYPLLLYFSLFGFTLEPRPHRSRFSPPKSFLNHINFSTPERQKMRSRIFVRITTVVETIPRNAYNTSQPSRHSSPKTSPKTNNPPSSQVSSFGSSQQQGSSHKTYTPSNIHKEKSNHSASAEKTEQPQTSLIARLALGNLSGGDKKYSWEYAVMLPTTPDEVRNEVEILLSDLIVRLKQLLFNSLLCAYYVGFIPMLFADSHLYYDKWWCVEHAFLVWANSFVILSSLLLPPSYCQLLYQCALHLGCWTRCTHDDSTNLWSADMTWPYDTVVQWNGESFKGEGVFNMAIPCDSSQEFFYLLFQSRLHVHTWLLMMQCITVLFQIVVLLRCIYWFQLLSMSALLLFNTFVFYRLLYNRLWFRKTLWIK